MPCWTAQTVSCSLERLQQETFLYRSHTHARTRTHARARTHALLLSTTLGPCFVRQSTCVLHRGTALQRSLSVSLLIASPSKLYSVIDSVFLLCHSFRLLHLPPIRCITHQLSCQVVLFILLHWMFAQCSTDKLQHQPCMCTSSWVSFSRAVFTFATCSATCSMCVSASRQATLHVSKEVCSRRCK